MALPEIDKTVLDQVLAYASPVKRLERQDGFEDGHPDIQMLLSAMDALDFTAPFDWLAEFRDHMDELKDPAAVAQADLEKLRKIMTAHIRIARTNPGHLEALIRNGYWGRCLDRLRQLRAEA